MSKLKEPTVESETTTGLSRAEKTIIYCIQVLNELVDDGVLEGDAYVVSEQGKKEIEGFKPTNKEIEFAMALFAKEGLIK